MTKIKIGKATNSVVVGGSVVNSTLRSTNTGHDAGDTFKDLKKAIDTINNIDQKSKIKEAAKRMEHSVGTPSYADHYKEFVTLASAHITILSPFIANLASFL